MRVTNNAQIREMDRIMVEEYQYPSLLLMETAGRKAAERILALYPAISRFLICCGPGNNGGDGLVVARYLQQAGKTVWLVFAQPADKFKGDAETNYKIVERSDLDHAVFAEVSDAQLSQFLHRGTIIIDAILGSGLQGELREPAASMLAHLRNKPNSVVALDMPSGLLGDTGAVLSRPLKCEYTLTFQLPKICHYVSPASQYCGRVETIDIGIYPSIEERLGLRTHLTTSDLIAEWYRPREQTTHKGNYGHVLFAGGSKGMAGSVAMATQAATEMGCGLCTAFIPGAISCAFHRTTLENMSIPYGTDYTPQLNETAADVFGTYLADKSAVGIGPGLGNSADTQAFMRNALPLISCPKVLDADALNILTACPDLWEQLGEQTILTPHPGEMARLMDQQTQEIQQRRLEYALQLARERNVIVVLKGAGTIVAAPLGEAYFCQHGNPGMATGGAGDVLTGAITGLLAQGYTPLQAAVIGVDLHARAGDTIARQNGLEGVTATKIMRSLGATLQTVLGERAYAARTGAPSREKAEDGA
jgi:NAD(P)H-hydrate epimerase